MDHAQPARTIAITYRNRSRFARVKLRRPTTGSRRDRLRAPYPDAPEDLAYDEDLAIELIAATGELPTRKRELIVVLTHYRRAIYDLATQARARRPASTS